MHELNTRSECGFPGHDRCPLVMKRRVFVTPKSLYSEVRDYYQVIRRLRIVMSFQKSV